MSGRKSGQGCDDSAENRLSGFAVIGASCCGLIFLLLGIVVSFQFKAESYLFHDDSPWSTDCLIKYHLLPTAVGIIIGGIIGWRLSIARGKRLFRAKLIAGWGLLGGWVAALVPTVVRFYGFYNDGGDSAAYHVVPAALGIAIGATIGWSVTVVRSERLSRAKLMFGWGLLGGWVAVLVPAVLIFIWAWLVGDVGDLTLAGVGHHRPAPRSLEAASQAMAVAAIFVILLGLPLFAIGSVVGAVVGAKKASRQIATRTLSAEP